MFFWYKDIEKAKKISISIVSNLVKKITSKNISLTIKVTLQTERIALPDISIGKSFLCSHKS